MTDHFSFQNVKTEATKKTKVTTTKVEKALVEQPKVVPVAPEVQVRLFDYKGTNGSWVWHLFFVLKFGFLLFQVLPEPASPTPMETSGCEPAGLCQAFSDVILHTAIRDVDADDYDNPMLCSEYVKDIYKYLRQLEASKTSTVPLTT